MPQSHAHAHSHSGKKPKASVMPMGVEEIKKYLPHRYPFLLVDRITELDGYTKIVGYKNITINEALFNGHFPNMAVFPGVLQIEAMSQVAGVLVYKWLEDPANHKSKTSLTPDSTLPMLAAVEEARFRRKVLPGDRMVMEIETDRCRVPLFACKARCLVDGEVASEAVLKFYLINRPEAEE